MPNYIVKLPFTGSIESETFTDLNGVERVAYSGYLYNNGGECLTVSEYLALPSKAGSTIVNSETIDKLINEYEKLLISEFKEIDSERFFYMLEVLPPCKWSTVSNVELFHVSERITGNLVSWFFKKGDQYFEKVDRDNVDKYSLVKGLN